MQAAAPAVTAAAFHPDGQRIAFGIHGEARIYKTSGESLGVLKGLEGRVTALAFSPNGKLLAAASGSPGKAGIVRIYDAERLTLLTTIAAHADIIHALAFAPDSAALASAGYDRLIHLWELPAALPAMIARPKLALKDHSDAIYSVAFHPDGKLLASASADRTVKVWDAATGQRLYTLGEPTDWLYAVRWSPDKTHLAAAGVDKSIRVWAADRNGGKLVHSVFAHEQPVWRLAYSRDGQALYSIGEDRIVKAWNAAKMAEIKVFPAQSDAILDFALAPSDKQFALACFNGLGGIFDATSGKLAMQMLPAATAPPKPTGLNPAAIQRGSSTRIAVAGTGLDRVSKVSASNADVRVGILSRSAKELALDVTVPPQAAAGAVQLVIEYEAGRAAPLTLAIDRYPAIAEKGGSESARAAQAISLPATVAGAIDRAGDMDFFRFDAKAGQQIGVQVVAAELGSKLDPVLVLTDAAGEVLAEGNSVLGYTAARAGSYSLGIRDREYRGATNMAYRLHIGDVPVITGVFPLAAQRGRTTRVHVDGVNLGSTAAISLAVPADAKPGSRMPLPLSKIGETPLGNASVLVDEFASVVVDPAGGTEIRVPGAADGILLKPRDAQIIRFHGKKGERLLLEVAARRAGSPVDPVLEILEAAGKPVRRAVLRCTSRLYSTFRDHDAASPGIRLESWDEIGIDDYLYADGELMRVIALPKGPDDDCQFYQSGGRRLGYLGTTPNAHAQGCPMYKVEFHPPGSIFPPNGLPTFALDYRNDDGGPAYGKDSLLFFDVPADGTYQARVSDARGAGGPTHAYRLTVRPPRPDFSISFTPTAPAVWKGGAIPVGINATRTDGFEGPIRVRLEGLPPGFSAPSTTIDASQLSTSIALFAEATASVPKGTMIKLKATAAIDGKEVVHEAIGGTPKLLDPGDIVTTTRQPSVAIRPGHESRLIVDVQRRGDFKGRVPVEVRGLPHGVRVLNIGLNGIL
ncbi:MAG TPA: WD40 repeat domain-containing protein, partial [Urbifossiella sp.]|nr:WD40 repeat domain-containing protein [Urbifossiella sp.]